MSRLACLCRCCRQDYSKPCPQKQPTAEALGQRTTSPKDGKPAAAAPALSKNLNPPGSQPGRCNAYLPGGTSTMARFLWVVQYFVANGFYVLADYHPEPGNTEPVVESVDMFAHNWLQLWSGLSCLPNYQKDLQGRVFLDLLNGEAPAWLVLWAPASTAAAAVVGRSSCVCLCPRMGAATHVVRSLLLSV